MDKTTKRLVVIAAGAVVLGLSSCSSNQYPDSDAAEQACKERRDNYNENAVIGFICRNVTREDASKPHYALDQDNEVVERFYY